MAFFEDLTKKTMDLAYVAADKAKDGQEHVKTYMGVCMTYDAQGTQIGGGKAYLDKGQEPARKDITIVFM